MLGDLAGHRVRVARPRPGNDDAFGVEGVARHAKKVAQGGLPLERISELLEEKEVQYYVDSTSSDDRHHAMTRTFSHSELEVLD